jgi:hypothetical protein
LLLIQVVNWPITIPEFVAVTTRELEGEERTELWQRELAEDIQEACVTAKAPEVAKDAVTVTFEGRQVLENSRTIVLKVVDLRSADLRTRPERRRLEDLLYKAVCARADQGWDCVVEIVKSPPPGRVSSGRFDGAIG